MLFLAAVGVICVPSVRPQPPSSRDSTSCVVNWQLPPPPSLSLSPSLSHYLLHLLPSRANLLTWVTLYMAIFAIIQLATNYVPSLTTVALIFLGTLAGMLTTLSVRSHSSCN